MSYMVHHSIIVSSSIDELFNMAYLKALEIFGDQVSNVVESNANGYRSFFIAPDGSKEGWVESNKGNNRRDEFITWLIQQKHDDGSSSLGWVEVQFDDGNKSTTIIHSSDDVFHVL